MVFIDNSALKTILKWFRKLKNSHKKSITYMDLHFSLVIILINYIANYQELIVK